MFCPNCGTPVSEAYQACPSCGTAVILQQPAAQMPMKWFKFLIYFSLWGRFIIYNFTAMSVMSGSRFFGYADTIYSLFPGQSIIDFVYGIGCILIGIYTLVTRFRLAQFFRNASKMLYGVYFLDIIFSLFYLIATASITLIPFAQLSDTPMMGQIAMQMVCHIIAAALLLLVNMIYFRKRREMFVC